MDRDGVGQRNLIQLAEVVFHQPVIESDREFLLNRIDLLDGADVAIKHFLLVVVLRLDDFVPDLEPPSKSLNGGLTWPNRVQSALQHDVQLADSDRSPIHRAQNLNVADRVEPMPLRDSILNQPNQGCGYILRRIPFYEVEVGTGLRCAKLRHFPLANEVGAGNDLTGGCLPEHFGQTNDRYHAAIDQVSQGISRPYGGELIHVADHDQSGSLGEAAEQGVHQEHVHHRGLIDDKEVAVKRLVFVAQKPSRGRIDFQQTVDCLRFHPGCLGEPLRGPTRGGTKKTFHFLCPEDQQDRVHEGGLTHTGAAGDNDDPAGQRGPQCFPLAWREHLSGLLLAPGDGLFKIDLWVGHSGCAQPFDLPRDAVLRLPQVRKENQRFAVDLLQQEKPAGQHLRHGLLDRLHRHFQQFHGR